MSQMLHGERGKGRAECINEADKRVVQKPTVDVVDCPNREAESQSAV